MSYIELKKKSFIFFPNKMKLYKTNNNRNEKAAILLSINNYDDDAIHISINKNSKKKNIT